MPDRLDFHKKLCDILESGNVYFQPPASVKMRYPAIVYSRERIETIHANNATYQWHPGYEVILIDKNPDSVYIEKLLQFECCSFVRHYESDGLNHDVFRIYDN